MLLPINVKMARDSIKSAKWRSLLTMLGIIIGVMSVVTIVSLGEGVKQQVVGQINHLGADLITVRPGKLIDRDQNGKVTDVSLLAALGGGTMSEADADLIEKTPGVKLAVPFSMVSGVARVDDRELKDGLIIGTTEDMPAALSQKVEFGSFFEKSESDRNFAVIGKRVAENLFQDNVPIGRVLQIRGQAFIVHGVFEDFPANPLTPNLDYNDAIFIPINVGKKLNAGQAQIQQVFVKPSDPAQLDDTVKLIDSELSAAHGGQRDYTILKQADSLAIANRIVNLLTGLISAIAAISLLVGGIGIMNIMLVSVTERTHEIGIRKAVGATDQQILTQFMIEAAMISFVGGVIGVLASLLLNYFMRIFTSLQPVITLPIVLAAVGVAMAVGVFFGITPALRAARKDPIEALRQI